VFNDLKRAFETTSTLTYKFTIIITYKTEFHAVVAVSRRSKPDIITPPPWNFEKKIHIEKVIKKKKFVLSNANTKTAILREEYCFLV
jgi:MinD superfamily P-loop ATPase